MKKNIFKSKPGTSLIIAIGLSTIIVLVSIGVTTVVVSSIRESANLTGANQAYYSAEGALEQGLLANQNQGAGFSTTNPQEVFKAPNESNYTIAGQVPVNEDYPDNSYGIPTPASGSAGINCNPLDPNIRTSNFSYDPVKGFTYGPSEANPSEENPCNWNKIQVGQTVTIPLYYTDPTTGNPMPIFNSGTGFTLNIRTGCTNGDAFCTARPIIDTTSGNNNYKYGSVFDDPIVSWEIDAQSPDLTKNYILSPILNWSTTFGWKPPTTIIYKSLINAGEKALIQTQGGADSSGCKGSIIKFLTGSGSGQPCASSWGNIYKPVLKLSLIHSISEFGAGQIPYLEYQILVTSPAAQPTDTNQTITAQGYSGTFKQVLEIKNPQESGLLEYVIQQ